MLMQMLSWHVHGLTPLLAIWSLSLFCIPTDTLPALTPKHQSPLSIGCKVDTVSGPFVSLGPDHLQAGKPTPHILTEAAFLRTDQ
jgi:hypothetical protein